MPRGSKNPEAKPDAADGREQRLAAALRENLRKRKAQQRGRGDVGATNGAPGGPVNAKPGGSGGRD